MKLHLVPIAEVTSSLVSKQLLILTVILLLPLVASCGTVTTSPTQTVATPAPEATLTPGVVVETPTPAPALWPPLQRLARTSPGLLSRRNPAPGRLRNLLH
jgi:hypothetical protein